MNGFDFLKVAPTHLHMLGAASQYDAVPLYYNFALIDMPHCHLTTKYFETSKSWVVSTFSHLLILLIEMHLLGGLQRVGGIKLNQQDPLKVLLENERLLSVLATAHLMWLPSDQSLGMSLFPCVWALLPTCVGFSSHPCRLSFPWCGFLFPELSYQSQHFGPGYQKKKEWKKKPAWLIASWSCVWFGLKGDPIIHDVNRISLKVSRRKNWHMFVNMHM